MGQLLLAVQIAVGISKGELDPDAPRQLEEGRKGSGVTAPAPGAPMPSPPAALAA